MSEVERIYGHCRACHMNCPAYYTVRDGKVVDIEAVPMSEDGVGELCPRGMASIQFLYSPTRLRYPLKRIGKRGEGKWQRISWDQACKEIAQKIYDMSNKYGAETFVLPGRTGRQDMGWIACKIARTIGTPNNYYGATQLCLLPQFLEELQFGHYLSIRAGTDPATRLFVSYGFEFSSYADCILGKFQTMAMQHGMKHIAVDPVCGPCASKADIWMPIRPGTDLAYNLTIINYLIENDTYDVATLKEWTNLAFLVNPVSGALLLEADIQEGGSVHRYQFWDTISNSLKWWDSEEIQWEGGQSGRAHYDQCVKNWNQNIGSHNLSPARLPENIDPALFGTYSITFKDGSIHNVQPAFQQLADSVKQWSFEKCNEVTGLPIDRIKASCEMIVAEHPIDFGVGGPQYMATNLSQFVLTMSLLKVMTGNLDVQGGATYVQFYPVEPQAFPGEWDISYNEGLDIEQKKKRLGYYKHPVISGRFHDEYYQKWHPIRPENADALNNVPDVSSVLKAAETGDPYEVHGIIAISSNWLMHEAGTQRWMKLIEDEDKIQLHVVADMVMTPTAELADYVLPATTWMERNYLEFGTLGASPKKNFFRKAIEPMWETKQDYFYGAKIAKELEKLDPKYNHGLLNPETSHFFAGEYGTLWETDTIDEERERITLAFFGKTLEECLEARQVTAQDYSPGAEYQHFLVSGRIPTETGKANLFSTVHQTYGFPPLPVYTEPEESPISRPELVEEFPLVCSTGKRQPGYFHSEFRQLPLMRQLSPHPDVLMNTGTAAEYGLKHGDWVWVQAPPTHGRGENSRVMGRVSLRFSMRPGQVTYSQHAWWRPEKPVEEDLHGAFEWNAEMLCACDGNGCPETGTLGLRSFLCKVYKCTDEEIEKYQPMITREQLEAFMPICEKEA